MINRPIFIIGCPRSGSTLLYTILSMVPDLWSIGYESKEIIEKYHHPSRKGWLSGELDSSDVTEVSRRYIISEFSNQSASGDFWKKINKIREIFRRARISSFFKSMGRTSSPGAEVSSKIPQQSLNLVRAYVNLRNNILPFLLPEHMEFLEKTPENCLRLPFLFELFPDGRIIYLIRDGRANIYSLMEGWREPHLFPGYKVPKKINIPSIDRDRWAFTLIPGWQGLLDKPLEEVCAWQWYRCNQAVMDFIEKKNDEIPTLRIKYEDLITHPPHVISDIANFLGYPLEKFHLGDNLPIINVVSEPSLMKWQKRENEVMRVFPIIAPMMDQLGYL